MSRICFVCGKAPKTANHVSKANNKVGRWVYPNVHKMRFVVADDCKGKVHNAKVCTKCVKASKVKKVF
jgi:large subunit ribosomal protein L28